MHGQALVGFAAVVGAHLLALACGGSSGSGRRSTATGGGTGGIGTGGVGDAAGTGGVDASCSPGTTRACSCPSGDDARQVCASSRVWGACDCPVAQAGAGGVGGSSTCPPDCGEMDRVPSGTFPMGCDPFSDPQSPCNEFPYHEVTLDPFRIDAFEVTVSEYTTCVTDGACTEPDTGTECNWTVAGREYHPINCVDWDQAVAYCTWAGKRLPTEAEWEMAARGTDGRIYPWGNELPSCTYAVIPEAGVDGCGTGSTMPVGSIPQGVSPGGAHDMGGNVYEWVADWYDYYYYSASPADHPTGPADGTDRVIRGGSYLSSDPATHARASDRALAPPDQRYPSVGIRCAMSGNSAGGAPGTWACPPDCGAQVDVFGGTFAMGCDPATDPNCPGAEFPVIDSTMPVGSLPAGAGPYGTMDLAGNVIEWIADRYDWTYYRDSPTINPTGPTTGDERVGRSSSWFGLEPRWTRASQRSGFDPTSNGNGIGFRCARNP